MTPQPASGRWRRLQDRWGRAVRTVLGSLRYEKKAPLETACQDCFGSFPGGPKMAGVYSPPALTGVYSGELENSLRWIYFPVCHGDFTFWKYTGTSSVRKAVAFECSLRLVQLPEALFCVRR